jgi:hypothetical protein
MTTPDDIRRILKKHPRLGVDGFDSPPVKNAGAFLKHVSAARPRFASRSADQVFSGQFAYWEGAGAGIPNGAAITAALLEGFYVFHQAGPNCVLRRLKPE